MTLRRVPAELADLRDRPRRLLSVFAHPDDESYGCAGTLFRAGVDPDTAVVHVCLTNGEAYSVLAAEGLDRAAVAAVRTERMVRVAEHVHLDGLLMPGFPDARLAREPLDRVAAYVGEVLDVFDPQVVVGSDPRGVNGHADHIAAHWVVRAALEARAPRRFAMIVYLQDLADAALPRLIFPTAESEVDAVVELGEAEIDAKEACLREHEALVTLREMDAEDLFWRPPVERYDLFGEGHSPALGDLFHGLEEAR